MDYTSSDATEEYFQASSDATEEYGDASSSSSIQPASAIPGLMSQVRLYKEAHLDNDAGCAQWLQHHGLIKTHLDCNAHRRPREFRMVPSRGAVFYCSSCRDDGQRYISAFRDTIFSNAHLPIGKVLMLALCYAHDATYDQTRIACTFSAGDPELPNKTIAHWFSLFRNKVVQKRREQLDVGSRIGGWGRIVQIDEALIGRYKNHVGRFVEGTWVLGMVDEDGRIRMEVVDRRDAQTLGDVISRNVEHGTEIWTDGWPAYRGLDQMQLGYSHKWVNHRERFVDDEGHHTQRIESAWRALRRHFSRGGIRKEDIPAHLTEYEWRRWCKKLHNVDPFSDLINTLAA